MAGGDYGRVRHTFWSDPDVKRKLSPGQKLLLLYFFSNPHTNLCGIYHLPLEYAALETGLDLEDVRRWTAGELGRFVSYDDDTEEVFVHRLAKHQVGEDLSPRDKRAPRIRSEVEGVHSRRLSSLFADTYASWGIVPATPAPEAPSKPLGSPFEAIAVHSIADTLVPPDGGTTEGGDENRGAAEPPDSPEPPEFAEAWAVLPPRDGTDSRRKALKAFRARLREGTTAKQLLDAAERYGRYCEATGKAGTQFVMQGATFFGPDGHWQQAWTVPPPTNGRPPMRIAI